MTKKNLDLETELTWRAWNSPAFAEALEKKPLETLKSMGVVVSPDVKVEIVLQRPDTLYFAIPPKKKAGDALNNIVINQMDLWCSGALFVWVLPEKLKVELLNMRRSIQGKPPARF